MSQAEWWHNPRYDENYARPQDAVAAGFKHVGHPVPREQYLTDIAQQIDNDRQLLADLRSALPYRRARLTAQRLRRELHEILPAIYSSEAEQRQRLDAALGAFIGPKRQGGRPLEIATYFGSYLTSLIEAAVIDTATNGDPGQKHKPCVRKSALTRNKHKIAGVLAWCLEAIDDRERDADNLLQATRRRKKPLDEFRYDPGEKA